MEKPLIKDYDGRPEMYDIALFDYCVFLESHIIELNKKITHLQNYATHTQFCGSVYGNGTKCDCGYIKK